MPTPTWSMCSSGSVCIRPTGPSSSPRGCGNRCSPTRLCAQTSVRTTTIRHHTEGNPATTAHNARLRRGDRCRSDRKIIIKAMARRFDIVASNHVNSIDHGMLKDWIENRGRKQLQIETTILRPEPAEEKLRARAPTGHRVEGGVHSIAYVPKDHCPNLPLPLGCRNKLSPVLFHSCVRTLRKSVEFDHLDVLPDVSPRSPSDTCALFDTGTHLLLRFWGFLGSS